MSIVYSIWNLFTHVLLVAFIYDWAKRKRNVRNY